MSASIRAVNSCSALRCVASPPLAIFRYHKLRSSLQYHHRRPSKYSEIRFSMYHCSSSCPIGARSYSVQSVFESIMEEFEAHRKLGRVRSTKNKLGLMSSEGLIEDKLEKRALQKGLLLEFKKDSERVLLAVAQKRDGRKNWMVFDQNGATTSIKPQQITYIVPGVENFDHAEISDFFQKAQSNLDSTVLEFAWVELLENNKSVTAEELAEMIFGSSEPLESYCAHLLLSRDEIYFTSLHSKGPCSVYGPRTTVQVEELQRRKLAKEAADKEFEEFVQLLRSAREMPPHAKPPKSSWKVEENVWHKIESLQAYAIDACKNDEQKTAGMILKAMGLTRTASSAVNLLIDIGYFPVHINLDLLKFNIRTDYPIEILSAAESLLLESSDPDEAGLLSTPNISTNSEIFCD